MRRSLWLVAATVLAAGRAGAEDKPTLAAIFGARPEISQIDLSPDGQRVLFVAPGPGEQSIAIVSDLDGQHADPLMKTTGDPSRLDWCNFVANDLFVCQVKGLVKGLVNGSDTLIPYTRLASLSEADKTPKLLGQKSSVYDARLRQFDGDIIDWLPDDNGAVLMSRSYIPESAGIEGIVNARTDDGLGVDRIDVRTAKSQRIEAPDQTVSYYISDGRGHVRLKSTETRSAERLTDRTVFFYRKAGSRDWIRFSEVTSDNNEIVPIAVDASIDSAYGIKKLDGRYALYRIKLDGSMAAELVYSNPKVDVDDVVRIGKGARVIGVTYVEDKRKTVYFDPEYEKLSAALSKTLPNLPIVKFVSSSHDGEKVLIFGGSDSDPGRYYLFDKSKRTLSAIGEVRPDLEGFTLAAVKPITYPAADGTMIPAYLTLPPGKEAKGLPAVVLPHGGPSARDEWGFDWLAQFLASQGYAVIQPNYRGSAGYGEDWSNENAFKGWRLAISDILDSAEWLKKEGIAAPDRLNIMGWSYGGYAALQAAVIAPKTFKHVVAIAPVTDFVLLKRQYANFENSKLVQDQIGKGSYLTEGSPLRNADKIDAPVLMFHGDRDFNVDYNHSRKMNDALKHAGKSSELVTFPGLSHDLDDSAARAQMLTRIAAFLAAGS